MFVESSAVIPGSRLGAELGAVGATLGLGTHGVLWKESGSAPRTAVASVSPRLPHGL